MFKLSIHPNTEVCNQAAHTIDEEQKALNVLLSSSPDIPSDKLDEIELKAKEALLQLKNSLATNKTRIWIINGLSFVTAILATGSNGFTAATDNNPVNKWIVFSVGTLIIWTNFFSSSYLTTSTLINEEQNTALTLMILEGVKQGKMLKKVIKSLKKIEKETKIGKHSGEQIEIIMDEKKGGESSLDQQITNFLKAYEQLKHKSDEVYAKIVPNLIRKSFPESDLLKERLIKLETYGSISVNSVFKQSQPIDVNIPNLQQIEEDEVKPQSQDLVDTEEESNKINKQYSETLTQFQEEFQNRFNVKFPYVYLAPPSTSLTPSKMRLQRDYNNSKN